KLRAEAGAGRRLVIIGAGYIGLEVAATARELGLEVTVLEMAERVMSRVTCPEVSAFYEAEHARQGVRIRCRESVAALRADPASGRVRAVVAQGGAEGRWPGGGGGAPRGAGGGGGGGGAPRRGPRAPRGGSARGGWSPTCPAAPRTGRSGRPATARPPSTASTAGTCASSPSTTP